nr:hypothetical protein [Tanacetum cinerariifolium]
LLWEDFVYQVEYKDAKKSNEMYYLRFTKVIINFFMTNDPSIPKRNKFGSMLPVELTYENIRNSAAYKEYYAISLGAAPPKMKASVRKTQSTKDEESFDPIVQTSSQVENSDDESIDDESHGMNVGGDEGPDAEDDDEELYKDVNINLEGQDVQMTDVHTTQVLEDTHVTLTLVNPDGQQQISIIVVPLLVTTPTLPQPSIPIMSQSDRLREEAQAENEDFLNKLDENIRKIIKEQVKEQVKTSYAVAADLSELELKKILIETMESIKSIHRSDEQRNLYKALVDAYECDKIILDTYGDSVTFKRCRDDADKDEEPESALAEEPMQTTQDFGKALTSIVRDSDLAKQADSRASFNELIDTPVDFLAFRMNRLNVDTLTPKLLAGLTYELMKGSCKSLVELEFFLEEVIIAVTELQIVEWHNYKHLDWIIMRIDDDKLYKFKEGNLKRLRIQDIEDMLLLLVQGKLTNLTVEEHFAFNLSLKMFTRSIVI